MRFLKRILVSVLVYEAVFLPFVVIMQTVSGGDYTAAYTVGGAAASVELILCALIKREENKKNKKADVSASAESEDIIYEEH